MCCNRRGLTEMMLFDWALTGFDVLISIGGVLIFIAIAPYVDDETLKREAAERSLLMGSITPTM
jgi:hypothetical protein